MESKTYIVFDTETVGLNPADNGCQILTLSAGVVDMESNTVTVEFDRYCHLTTQVVAKMQLEKCLGVDTEIKYATVTDCIERSGWNKNHNKDGTEKEVLQTFYCYVTSHSDPVLMAYNATFDMKWVNSRLKHYELPILEVEVIDVMETARVELEPVLDEKSDNGDIKAKQMLDYVTKKTEKRTWRSYSLENMAKMFGVYEMEAHESHADVIMAGKVFINIKNFITGNKVNPVYLSNSLKRFRELNKFFRSEDNWNRIYSKKRKKLLKMCIKNHMLAAASYRDFLIAELKRETRRNRNDERRSRMIRDNLLALHELVERRSGKKDVAKLIYFGMS